jgi:hypothetical protein
VWIGMRKSAMKESDAVIGIFGQQENYLYLGLVLTYFGVNLYRMKERSLFPALLAILVITLTLVAK